MNYDYTDKIIAYLDRVLLKEFSKLKGVVSFDELNILEKVNEVYQDIDNSARKAYLRLANKSYSDNLRIAQTRKLDEQWVDEMLDAYDPVSKYVYNNEIDRKRARLIEAIIASSDKIYEINAALRSMSLMFRTYAVRTTDEAVLKAFTDSGIKYVRWIAEKDSKTCKVCYKRDGNIYPIRSLPPKPHFNCRCRFEAVR